MAEVGRFRRRGRPFDFSQGVPTAGRYPPDGLAIAEALELLRLAPVEIGYGFDASGRQVFRQVGDSDVIGGFEQRDLTAITDGTFVHSHPPYAEFPEGDPRRRAGAFSLLDLVFLYELQLAEMIAVTKERTYRLRRLPEGFFLDPGQLRDEYVVQRRRVRRLLRRSAARGIISKEEAVSAGRIADEVMERLRLYFAYEWVEVPEDAS